MTALVLLRFIVHDHDNLFVAAEAVHSIGISVLIYKLMKEKTCAGTFVFSALAILFDLDIRKSKFQTASTLVRIVPRSNFKRSPSLARPGFSVSSLTTPMSAMSSCKILRNLPCVVPIFVNIEAVANVQTLNLITYLSFYTDSEVKVGI
ncbi:hypothetical protein F8388_022941 [Cannabis sativa]|uniref:Uncharacterized protein n=1 Tax=Cannabis sativa TaxID=3483 RepID=A0A7J6FU10_CANSA|nr:hypothetical protein F8388_022941 [Cannabis sativa]